MIGRSVEGGATDQNTKIIYRLTLCYENENILAGPQAILGLRLTYCSFQATHHEQNLQHYSDELLFRLRVRALDQLESQWFLMVTTRRQHYHKIS